jgi:PDZ domain-containing protein
VGGRIVAVDGEPVAIPPRSVPRCRPRTRREVTVTARGVRLDETVTTGRDEGSASCTPVRRRRSAGWRADEAPSRASASCPSFVDYTFPVEVEIDTARVGGPSAGLAFTLAIIDDMTPGSLTGGKRVAVTGAIDVDGRVGIVGGVEQKAITARTNRVQLMLVPKGEVRDARRGAGEVRVVGVDTIDEALAALQSAGGAAVRQPPRPRRS